MPVISAFRKWRQEEQKVKVILSYVVSLKLKNRTYLSHVSYWLLESTGLLNTHHAVNTKYLGTHVEDKRIHPAIDYAFETQEPVLEMGKPANLSLIKGYVHCKYGRGSGKDMVLGINIRPGVE